MAWQIEELRNLHNSYERAQKNIEDFEKDKKRLEDSLKEKESLKDNLENIIFATKLIIEKITVESKNSLESFLSYALKEIFDDRDYEIKLVFKEDTKKPGLEFVLSEGGVDQEISDAVGGGIISTLGLLLQIYYIEVYKVNKILFIDEGLKEVSSAKIGNGETKSYLENLLAFLKWLAYEKQYRLIVVTHDNKVREYADKIYEVRKGVVTECLNT